MQRELKMLPHKRGVIAAIRKKHAGQPIRPVTARDVEVVEAAVEKSKEQGRERLAVVAAIVKRKKTLF